MNITLFGMLILLLVAGGIAAVLLSRTGAADGGASTRDEDEELDRVLEGIERMNERVANLETILSERR